MANTSSPVGLASKYDFLQATLHRRSTIATKKESPIPDSRIVELVKHSILHTPSPFHVQSTRAVVLLHQDHEKLWDFAYENAEKTYPPELFERLSPNIKQFKQAYGSVGMMICFTYSSPRSADPRDRFSSMMTPRPSAACHPCWVT